MKKQQTIWFVILAILGSFVGGTLGFLYTYSGGIPQAEEIIIEETEENKTEEIEEAQETQETEVMPTTSKEDKITPSTKIVYEYYFTEDQITQTQEEVPPYFLLDLTLSDMLKYYTTWDIVSFSSKEVVMRKTIVGPSEQRYIIGEKEGFITVFYEQEQNGINIKEMTDITIYGLSMEEQFKLKEGIHVIGEDALYRILESYTS